MDSFTSLIIEFVPWFAAMAALLLFSASLSCGEAAFFYLSHADRAVMRRGNAAQRVAVALLDKPDRLLSAILFWNLLVNIVYFALATIVGGRLDARSDSGNLVGVLLGFGMLMTIIFFGEMLPKTLGVQQPRWMATLLGVPVAVAVRVLDPAMPIINAANVASRRLIWPSFQPEEYLKVHDLERAVELSTDDAALLEQERAVLRNIVALTDTRVDEAMRPRNQFLAFSPPVNLGDIQADRPRSGYVLITEADTDEIRAALPLSDLPLLPPSRIERYAEPVIYVPWSADLATAWDEMVRRRRNVCAVVNEFGETIGVLTRNDVLESLFGESASRSQRLMNRQPIQEIQPGLWHVTGMATLRRISRHLSQPMPESRSTTVKGLLHEQLQRLPQVGDVCQVGALRFKVVDAPDRGWLLVELTLERARTDGK